jgi:nicotinamidase/pyrazinamidase
MVVLTKDMHPQNHISFASVHNMNPYTTIDIDGLPQELWPDHCVRGTEGAELSNLLETNGNEFIV